MEESNRDKLYRLEYERAAWFLNDDSVKLSAGQVAERNRLDVEIARLTVELGGQVRSATDYVDYLFAKLGKGA